MSEALAGIPRPLRDGDLLAEIRELDRQYLDGGYSGPLVIELHYDKGNPAKGKVRGEKTFPLSATKLRRASGE